MSSGSGTNSIHESALFQQHLEEHRQKRKLQSELLDIAKSTRVTSNVYYEMHIDTFNLFRHAHDGLEPVFSAVPLYDVERDLSVASRPSAAEYAKFAEVFLDYVSQLFEDRVTAGVSDGLSERLLKDEIWKVVNGAKSAEEIPNAKNIVCFHRSVNLFGAKFPKDELIRCIDREIRWSKRQGDERSMQNWIELRRKLVEDDVVDLTGNKAERRGRKRGTKDYKFYNDFLDALVEHGANDSLPGFYKHFLSEGRFESHSEKGVDTSLAVTSVSLAFDKPTYHQVFCISDTDFLPVFQKLDELGSHFLVFYINRNGKVPQEFRHYERSGRLVALGFDDICEEVIEQFVHLFSEGDGSLQYKGENRHVYQLLALGRWEEMNRSWNEALERMNQEYYNSLEDHEG